MKLFICAALAITIGLMAQTTGVNAVEGYSLDPNDPQGGDVGITAHFDNVDVQPEAPLLVAKPGVINVAGQFGQNVENAPSSAGLQFGHYGNFGGYGGRQIGHLANIAGQHWFGQQGNFGGRPTRRIIGARGLVTRGGFNKMPATGVADGVAATAGTPENVVEGAGNVAVTADIKLGHNTGIAGGLNYNGRTRDFPRVRNGGFAHRLTFDLPRDGAVSADMKVGQNTGFAGGLNLGLTRDIPRVRNGGFAHPLTFDLPRPVVAVAAVGDGLTDDIKVGPPSAVAGGFTHGLTRDVPRQRFAHGALPDRTARFNHGSVPDRTARFNHGLLPYRSARFNQGLTRGVGHSTGRFTNGFNHGLTRSTGRFTQGFKPTGHFTNGRTGGFGHRGTPKFTGSRTKGFNFESKAGTECYYCQEV